MPHHPTVSELSRSTLAHEGGARWQYPARALHLVDVENLADVPVPSLEHVRALEPRYAERVGYGTLDQVVLAASSRQCLLNVGLGWPAARRLVRFGPDGADLALLDVISREDVAQRFTSIVIASGGGIFAWAAASLAAAAAGMSTILSALDEASDSARAAGGRRAPDRP